MFRFITPYLILVFGLSACKDRGNPIIPEEHFEAGPILFVSNKSGTSQLYSMNEDGSDVKQLTHDPNFPITDARWSPDGSKIAIESPVGGVDLHGDAIYVMNADGTGRYLLTKQTVEVNDSAYGTISYAGAIIPIWSPDSKLIAFTRQMVPEALANRDIFLVNVDGTNETSVTKTISSSETVTDWSPDGTLFLGTVINRSKRDAGTVVALISQDGRIQQQITQDSVTSSSGLWGPDQKYVVFTSWGGMRHELYLSSADGSNKQIIPTTTNVFNYPIAWSNTGEKILFNSSGGKIFTINKDGNNLVDITPKNLSNTGATSWRRR